MVNNSIDKQGSKVITVSIIFMIVLALIIVSTIFVNEYGHEFFNNDTNQTEIENTTQYKDDLVSVSIENNQIIIQLKANLSTGYAWYTTSNYMSDSTYDENTNIVGAGGIQTFVFQKEENMNLVFNYQRAHDSVPSNTINININGNNVGVSYGKILES